MPKQKPADSKKGITRRKTPPHLLSIFKEIFNFALDERGIPPLHHGRQRAVSDRYEVSVSAARKWVTGECLPDTDNLIMLADDLGYTVDMLIGREPLVKKGKTIAIQVKGLIGGAETSGVVHFDDALLDTSMRMKHNNLELHIVATDSMAPQINVNDIAFVDTSADKLEDNKIYLFMTNDSRMIIRRVLLGLDAIITLNADNSSYNPIPVKRTDIYIGPLTPKKSYPLRLLGQIPWTIKRVVK